MARGKVGDHYVVIFHDLPKLRTGSEVGKMIYQTGE